MGELDEKLNSILSSPKDMEKILGLARELSGSFGGDPAAPPKSAQQNDGASGGLDPALVKVITRLMGEYSSAEGDKSALVSSLKPYLKEQRRGDLDRAVKIAKLAHVAKLAFSEFSGGDFNL